MTGDRRRAAALAMIAAAAALLLGLPVMPSLVFRAYRTGVALAALPARRNAVLELSYVHSVNKGSVVDRFTIGDDGALTLDSTVFESFGAGMSDGREVGAVFALSDEGMELTGLGRRIGRLVLAVGTVADHQVVFGDRRFPLAAVAAGGTALGIGYERVSLWTWLMTSSLRRALSRDGKRKT